MRKLIGFIFILAMILSTLCFSAYADSNVTWNPNDKGSNFVFSDSSLLNVSKNADSYQSIRATTGKASGKWYWEVTVGNIGGAGGDFYDIGIATKDFNLNTNTGSSLYVAAYGNAGMKRGFGKDGQAGSYATFTTNDTISVLLDLDNHTISFWKNGVSQGQFSNSLSQSEWYPMLYMYPINSSATTNFGATTFKYSIPSGYLPFDNSQQALPAPTNLIATANNSQVSLSWSTVIGATSYNVKRSTTAGGPYTTIASNITGATYADSNVSSGNTYYYVVTTVASSGESSNSNEASANIAASNNAILEVTMTNGTIKEYDMTGAELDSFLTWYDDRSNGTGKSYFTITKKYNIKPYLSRKEYLPFDKILNFEVKEYRDN